MRVSRNHQQTVRLRDSPIRRIFQRIYLRRDWRGFVWAGTQRLHEGRTLSTGVERFAVENGARVFAEDEPERRVIAVARDPLVDLLGAVVVALKKDGWHHFDAPYPCCLHPCTHPRRFPSPPPSPPPPARPFPVGGLVSAPCSGAPPPPPTLSSLHNCIDGSGIERARVRPLGSLVEHLMREVLSGHQVTQKPPGPIRGALSASSLASIQKESESFWSRS
jgi:hypothetical protein